MPGSTVEGLVMDAPARSRHLTVESLVIAVLTLFGFRIGARPIRDNSMFTHLRTGIDMVRSGGIPRTDPYSFTAHGSPWVVQSWLAEWTYGVLHQLGGLRAVVFEQGVLAATVAFLVARLARAGSLLRTAAAGALALGCGIALWSPRPLLFGMVAFAAMVTVVEQDRRRWLLVPIACVWVNTHGSFVLGLVWLALLAGGELFDTRRLPMQRIRQAAWFALGLLAGSLNPLGPKLLLFPLAVREKSAVFSRVVEWKSPNFHDPLLLLTLLCALIVLVVLLRRPTPWRDVVPIVGFLLLGLVAVRNFPLLGIVVAPALGRALRRQDGGQPNPVNLAAVVGVALIGAVFGATAMTASPLNTRGYPEEAVAFVHDNGLFDAPHRVAEQDFVGNYVGLLYGTRSQVFIHDRLDMFPVSVSDDFHELHTGGSRTLQVLDLRRIDVVLWRDEAPLVTVLKATGEWQEIHRSHGFVVLQRDQRQKRPQPQQPGSGGLGPSDL